MQRGEKCQFQISSSNSSQRSFNFFNIKDVRKFWRPLCILDLNLLSQHTSLIFSTIYWRVEGQKDVGEKSVCIRIIHQYTIIFFQVPKKMPVIMSINITIFLTILKESCEVAGMVCCSHFCSKWFGAQAIEKSWRRI